MARIILIDDEDAVRRTVRLALERAGHQVLEASDGEAGLKLLAQSGADLVITDIFMPGQDGIVTVRRIRKESPGVKVIAVSGGDSTGRLDLRKGAELLGAATSLRKPFSSADLLRAVRDVLGLGSEPPPRNGGRWRLLFFEGGGRRRRRGIGSSPGASVVKGHA